ncbi:MAG: alpha-tubulin suppressor-like RCC1 family protein [Myxococcota bacterium]|jgi:alpha-tubulin suppressor-like RCC1 family protein
MSAGISHTCWLESGEVRCTGDNILFQSGHDKADEDLNTLNRVPMPDDDPAEQLACGGHSSCVITASGAPLCWGRDIDGQGWGGGAQNGTGHPDPQVLKGWTGDRALSLAVGAYVACIRFEDGV